MASTSRIMLIGIVIVASLLRLAGMFDDFWLDEIWSYNIARQVHNPLDVLLARQARWDNNHPLNTLFIWLLGEQHWVVYRIPALLAGIGSVIMACLIGLRRGAVEATFATLLVGFSYPLIFFSSEARGYALAVLFALIAFDAVERYLDKPRTLSAFTFGVASVLGLLAHLTFIHFYAGAAVWTGYRLTRARPLRVAAGELFQLHALPLLAIAALYLTFIRHLTVGGAPPQPLWEGLAESIAALLLIEAATAWDIAVLALAIMGLIQLLRSTTQRASGLWLFLLVATVISPAVLLTRQALLLDRPQPIAPRYFLVLLPFVFLTIAFELPRHLRDSRRQAIVGLGLAVFLAVNLWQTIQFLRVGRGHYADAVRYMAQHSPGETVAIMYDHAFRTGMVLNFYKRVLPADKQMILYDGVDHPLGPFSHGPPGWIVVHTNQRGETPKSFTDPQGVRYPFVREFSYYGLSGYSFYVYQRRER